MHYKINKLLFSIIPVFVLLSFTSSVPAAEKEAAGDKIAAVNGSIITLNDFNRELNLVKERLLQMGSSVNDSQLPELKKKVLENLISLEVLYQESQKAGIKVEQEMVDKKFSSIKSGFSNEDEFNEWLKRMNTSETDLKTQILRQMSIYDHIKTHVEANIYVKDEEARAYYDNHPDISKQPEKIRVSHILIKVAPDSDEVQKDDARKKIETIQEKLKKGEDFEILARESSDCPSASKGGDLGYFARGRMVKPFEDAAFALKPGQVSGIVETQFGYHLIKSVDKKPEAITPYENTKNEIVTILKREKIRSEAIRYIDKLKEKAKIEIFLSEKNDKWK